MQPADPLRVLELARRARAAALDHEACPRCGSALLIRWGAFSRRQRYRCKACGRTFSDFTGTSAAYCKRIDLWLDYSTGMIGSETVRRAATRLQVSRSTAFRWRHRLLAGLRRAAAAPLGGRVEVGELVLRHSEKGARRLDRPARRRGGGTPEGGDRVIVVFGHAAAASRAASRPAAADPASAALVATDSACAALAEVAGRNLLTVAMLRRSLLPRLAAACTLLARAGAFSAYGALCRSAGLRFERLVAAPGGGLAVARPAPQGVAGLRRRYQGWITTFRGVATRYLPHYLSWFCFMERSGSKRPEIAARTLLSLALRPTPPAAPAGA